MNTLSIVLLSLLAGIAIALLISAAIYLGWMQQRLRRQLDQSLLDLSRDIDSAHNSIHESATAAISELRLLKTEVGAMLTTHQRVMEAEVAKINGEQTAKAAVTIIGSARRIEQACVAFGTLAQTLLSEDALGLAKVRDSNLGAEEYAQASVGERFVTQSRTAAQDSDDLAAAGEEPEAE